MRTFSDISAVLRRKNWQQYTLLFGSLFFSELLITAFGLMMRSPTVLNVLPVGGDSRKMVMMIFVLSAVGCGAFVLYASGLFFRYKSREAGIFLALGASKKAISRQLRKELFRLALLVCILGMALGTPLAWLVWGLFRLTLVDTPEMALLFDFHAYAIPAAFAVFLLAALLLLLSAFLKRTNILDIISESHRAEPIHAVPRWFGPAGIFLLIAGAALGYFTPTFCVRVLHWYPPEGLTAIFYLPALAGLYILLLHTVVNGWRRGRSRYRHLVTTSMMQFQGRQTVRNMLVVTVLAAGAYFAIFYVPTIVTPAKISMANRPEDYSFFYRSDQNLPSRAEIEKLAEKYGAAVRGYVQQPSCTLAVDGYASVETTGSLGTTYTEEYRKELESRRFFSESAWNALTGEQLDLEPGTTAAIFDHDGSGGGYIENNITSVTNPLTGQTLSVKSIEPVLKSDLLFCCQVLDDSDYAKITSALTPDWQEQQVFFNVENDSYDFAKSLFHEIVARSGPEVELCDGYDRIKREYCLKNGKEYPFDAENVEKYDLPVIDYDQPDSSTFRLYWLYMPQFRILDQENLVTNLAVFLLLFVFVAILCFAAVSMILFTRSMTLVLINAWVYEDLHKLGASAAYLKKTMRRQISTVFFAPLLTGTLMIIGFYLLILFGNSEGGITKNEWAGMAGCLAITAVISAALYGLYRMTLRLCWKKL